MTFIYPCIANIFSEYNEKDAMFLKFIYFCKMLYIFQTVFLSINRSTKLHIQHQAFVRLLLLPADSLSDCYCYLPISCQTVTATCRYPVRLLLLPADMLSDCYCYLSISCQTVTATCRYPVRLLLLPADILSDCYCYLLIACQTYCYLLISCQTVTATCWYPVWLLLLPADILSHCYCTCC